MAFAEKQTACLNAPLQRHESGVVELGGTWAADIGGKAVEREALGAGDVTCELWVEWSE